MAIERKYCTNHPDRVAIGLCMVTRKPICAECSTRYNGVNYSREGLEILRERRRRLAARKGGVKIPHLVLLGVFMSGIAFAAYLLLGLLLREILWA